MLTTNRVDRIERVLDDGGTDVIYVITREGHLPTIVRINGEAFLRQEGESLPEATERALKLYRTQFKPMGKVSVLIMDCRH